MHANTLLNEICISNYEGKERKSKGESYVEQVNTGTPKK